MNECICFNFIYMYILILRERKRMLLYIYTGDNIYIEEINTIQQGKLVIAPLTGKL